MNYRNMRVFKAKSLVTFFAVEVTVHFLDVAYVGVVAHTIFRGAAAVINLVYDVMLMKSGQRAEDCGLVHAVELFFQISEAECVVYAVDRSVHKNSHGSRSDAVLR